MAQAVRQRPLTAEERVQPQANPRGFGGAQNDNGTDFFPPNISVGMSPPLVHVHSFIYH